MITLNQVLLLEQKVESAVAKIQQLEAENDALRKKCSELTNALSAKSEQLSTFETDQNEIEQGIRKALDRLTSIENSVLKAAGQIQQTNQTQVAAQQTFVEKEQPAVETPKETIVNPNNNLSENIIQRNSFETMETINSDNTSLQNSAQSFENNIAQNALFQQNEMDLNTNPELPSENPAEESFDSDYPDEYAEDNPQDDLGFDIF